MTYVDVAGLPNMTLERNCDDGCCGCCGWGSDTDGQASLIVRGLGLSDAAGDSTNVPRLLTARTLSQRSPHRLCTSVGWPVQRPSPLPLQIRPDEGLFHAATRPVNWQSPETVETPLSWFLTVRDADH
jgi:hypothetical protein